MSHEFKDSPKKQTKSPVLPFHTQPLTPSPSVALLCTHGFPYSNSVRRNRALVQLRTDCTGSGGMELTFFTAAGMVLCCGFGTKTALITQQCFTYCWAVFAQHQSLLFFSTLASQQVGWGCARSWEGTQPGQLARGVFHAIWHRAQQ